MCFLDEVFLDNSSSNIVSFKTKEKLMSKATMLCLLLVLCLVPVVWSGNITPPLASKMEGLASNATLEALVMFQSQADIPALNLQLKREHATLAERNRRVLEALHEAANQSQPSMVAYLDQLKSEGKIESYQMLWIANMFIVKATNDGIRTLAARNELADLYFSYPIENIAPVDVRESDQSLIASHEMGLTRIHAPEAWALGFTGAGRVVSNIDTGVDGTHPALRDRWRGTHGGTPENSWYDPYDTHWTQPQDSGQHGTHTMGTICGRSPAGDTIGVAIDAQWIASASIDRGGGISRTISDAILSFQWIADPDGDPNTQDNPDACGNSWGIPDGAGYPDCDESFWQVIDNAEAAGTAVIFSAGNESTSGLRSPADRATTLYNCFSVGAVDGATPALPLAYFSSQGPTECASGELSIKPEVVAPGVNIRSAMPGGGYQFMDGTSMASPHVTGAVAVIRQVNPNLDVDAIKEILMNTATPLPTPTSPENNQYGHGNINLYEACLIAQSGYGYAEGYVRNAQSQPIANAEVSVTGTTRRVMANADGLYFIGLPADTSYMLKASYFGYLPDSGVVAITADDTTMRNFVLNSAPYGFVEGHVRDLNSNPINGAILRVVGTPIPEVQSNSTGYYLIPNIPGGNSYSIQAIASGFGSGLVTVNVPVNDTATADFTLQPLESFEVNNGGWMGEGVWEWGIPTSGPGAAYDGEKVWATVLGGAYPDNADDALITTYYGINDANAVFSFYHWFDFENSFDGGNVSASVDGGQTWELLTPDGGYPDDAIVGLGNEPGFTSSSNDWVQATFPVGVYAGQNIKLRFRFGSDGSVQRDGWYIDGVAMSGGVALHPSLSDISPTSFNVDLDSGQIRSYSISMTNSGTAPLDFTTKVFTNDRRRPIHPIDSPNVDQYITKSTVGEQTIYTYNGPKNNEPVIHGNGMIANSGGPDEFGYVWKDSREANGPTYSWVDISAIGTPIEGLADDNNVGPFAFDFDFTFYGNSFNTFNVCSNGFISFTSTSASLGNSALPSGYEPYNLIAAIWDDLDFRSAGEAYYYSTSESLVVSFTNVPRYGSGGPFNYQIILLSSGDIILQYGETGDRSNESTVGIQNADGTVGLTIAYNEDYIENELAVKISYPLFWLAADPGIGQVAPGQTGSIDVTFDASQLAIGTYTGEVSIGTNDPSHMTISVPCTLRVGTVGIADESAIPTVFSMAQNFPNPFNPTTDISFGLPNAGKINLEVYDIMGRRVKTLVNGELAAGVHKISWNGTNDKGEHISSGVYFYKLSSGDNVVTKKMVMLK
jgi:subtilisin family serine protease